MRTVKHSWRTFGPHRGVRWVAVRSGKGPAVTFTPFQIFGGRRWSLVVVRIQDVEVS